MVLRIPPHLAHSSAKPKSAAIFRGRRVAPFRRGIYPDARARKRCNISVDASQSRSSNGQAPAEGANFGTMIPEISEFYAIRAWRPAAQLLTFGIGEFDCCRKVE